MVRERVNLDEVLIGGSGHQQSRADVERADVESTLVPHLDDIPAEDVPLPEPDAALSDILRRRRFGPPSRPDSPWEAFRQRHN